MMLKLKLLIRILNYAILIGTALLKLRQMYAEARTAPAPAGPVPLQGRATFVQPLALPGEKQVAPYYGRKIV